MKRRAFIAGLGSVAAWPVVARADQPSGMPVIGFLNSGSFETYGPQLVSAFMKGLEDVDYVDGRNIVIEYRWAAGVMDELPLLAADLVSRRVKVIVATGGGASAALAAKGATSTIPIVFTAGVDPIKSGLVASFNRPGGNATGATTFSAELGTKRLGVLHELLPQATLIAFLINPKNPGVIGELADLAGAARALGQRIEVVKAGADNELDDAFATAAQARAHALIVEGDPLFNNRLELISKLAAHYAIPAIATGREYVELGGLMSYGTRIREAYRQVGVYAGRILKGANPADLPVVQASKFELVINLQTAKALGLGIPPTLLARADEVIE